METKEKIIFIVGFIIAYALLLLLGVYVFGNILVGIEESLIKLVLRDIVNYNNFEFVIYCSGIVSISTYLAVIAGFLAITIKPEAKVVVASVILLWLVNLIRIIVVMLADNIGIANIVHVFSWFFTAAIVVWLVKICVGEKNANKKSKH